MERESDLSYAVPASVRVRKETFGLLFYDTEESRLTFVRSKDLLHIETPPHGNKMISTRVAPEARGGVSKLLDQLLQKRLIREP